MPTCLAPSSVQENIQFLRLSQHCDNRHNWLYAGSPRGAHAAATILSLIESCKLVGVEPYAYLQDVLKPINSHRVDRLAELLPFNWVPKAATAAT